MIDPSDGLRLKAASHALMNEDKSAASTREIILKKNPTFSVKVWRSKQPDSDPSEVEHFCAGLSMAGLPN